MLDDKNVKKRDNNVRL